MNFLVLIFFVRKKVYGEEGRTRNIKKQPKMKKDYFTHSFQKQQTNKRTEKERKMAEREKAEDVLVEKQHFFRYITTGKTKNAKTGDHFF